MENTNKRTIKAFSLFLLLLFSFLTGACSREDSEVQGKDPDNPGKVSEEKLKYIVVSHESADEEMFKSISQRLGNSATSANRVGVSLFLCYLQVSPDQAKSSLINFLNLADKYSLPVMIQFDGIDYQNAHPELWNWWDPSKPGYHPDNRNNVEWTSWTPDSALKIGWRNWGSQHRVGPMPNLMSPAYLNACATQLKILIPVVLNWWKEPGKNHELVGIQMENEVSVGVNNYVLPGGNEYVDKPAASDPVFNLNMNVWPGFGARPIGYAAVQTLGLAISGPLLESDVAKVTDKYLSELCLVASGMGVPREKLFTHTGGWKKGQLFYFSALNEYSCPGWSFYTYAKNPQADETAMEALQKSQAPYWCNAETFLMNGKTEQDWIDCLNNNLKIPGIRYVNIRNWRGMKDKDFLFNAIKKVQSN